MGGQFDRTSVVGEHGVRELGVDDLVEVEA
jgi:hypothetical protein